MPSSTGRARRSPATRAPTWSWCSCLSRSSARSGNGPTAPANALLAAGAHRGFAGTPGVDDKLVALDSGDRRVDQVRAEDRRLDRFPAERAPEGGQRGRIGHLEGATANLGVAVG